MKTKRLRRKAVSILLSLALIFTAAPAALGAGDASGGSAAIDPSKYERLSGTDFEDGDVWGFSGGSATAAIVEEGTNKHLLASGSGSGSRSVVKALAEPTNSAEVLFRFDWLPGEVKTGVNSSEVLFSDTKDNPLLRIVKEGGPNGKIKYGAGTTDVDLSTLATVTGVTYEQKWLSVQVQFDFANENVFIEVQDRDDHTKQYSSPAISLSSMNYVNQIATMTVKGNRASGNHLEFTAGLDNIAIYGSDELAPEQGEQKIASIATPIQSAVTVLKGTSKADAAANFPSAVDVKLTDDVIVSGVPIHWDSADYNADQLGVYSFTGVLNVDGIANVVNSDNISASASVTVAEGTEAPVIEGYENIYYSDFGDIVAPVPVNWGFTTANAALSTPSEELAGNATPKLQFTITNQSGGRVATKKLDTAVKGNHILLAFDWYSGKVNDKGANNANENGGELRIVDSNANVIFTLNNTNKAALSYYAGLNSGAAVSTGFTNAEAWYRVEVNFDLVNNETTLKLTDKSSLESELYTIPMDDIAFDGSVAEIRLGGVRTSGNNITWTTYLDNFGIYHVPIPGNTIVLVDKLPYHRVYVGETTNELSSIGLPSTVTVTLADNSKAEIAVNEWNVIGKPWASNDAGVYTFKGELADSDELLNTFKRSAVLYVYNRLTLLDNARQTEWLDRGAIALQSENGIFVSWRLLADEYSQDITFNIYRNGVRLNNTPLRITNFEDKAGAAGDEYKIETLLHGNVTDIATTIAADKDYLSILMQKPEGGMTASGVYTYSVNDASVGDLDGDGQYEIIVKWYPSNAIDSSQQAMTGPTIFDAYQLDGSLMWRINMGHNLTSGAHYHQFIVADLDGDGKSELLIKTADATTVYGTTNGLYDNEKVIAVIGNAADDGKWVNEAGHVYGGPEYMTAFDGETGAVIDTVDYAFPLGDVASWGDTWHNRSDRFLAGLAYLDGVSPSAVFGRGYYERTTFVAYSLVDGKLQEQWTFDSDAAGKGRGLGYHSLATGDVDNDGKDEIIAGSMVLDQDGTILYMMDGEMGREKGSHGDAMHVGAFDPEREGLHFIGVHEDPAVASLEYHDGATGETIMSFYASVDAGRGLAANITERPGYEFWGNAGHDAASGGGIYNVQGEVVSNSFRNAGLSTNFALYWDGDLLHELLDNTSITKYNEALDSTKLLKAFEGVMSSNGTKATPTLQADLLGDWREEVLLPTTDSSELRIHSTTIPTEYGLYTLMHDTVYRMGIAWQNTAYNQPPHLGFYLGEDIRERVLAGNLEAPQVAYTNKPAKPTDPVTPDTPSFGGNVPAQVTVEADGAASLRMKSDKNESTGQVKAELTKAVFQYALSLAKADAKGLRKVVADVSDQGDSFAVTLPAVALNSSSDHSQLALKTSAGTITLPSNMLTGEELSDSDDVQLLFHHVQPTDGSDRIVIEISFLVNGVSKAWSSSNVYVRISLPYELTEEEAEKHEQLAVVYVDEQGNRSPIYNGRYNEAKGTVDFRTNHFSQFAVAYVEKSFRDLIGYGWAQRSIEALASKGIITGTSESLGTFTPGANITRADFTILLVKTLGLQAEEWGSFSDVQPSDYYYEAVGIAKALGIASGQGDDRFNPRAAITRQDMIVLTARALNAANAAEEQAADLSVLAGYSDNEQVADYAREAIAAFVAQQLIEGSDGHLKPLNFTTRAEAAVLLYRIFQLTE